MVAASDVPPDPQSLAQAPRGVWDVLCTSSPVSPGSAQLRVMRTAGEGHACWCIAACWVQPRLALILLRSVPRSPR